MVKVVGFKCLNNPVMSFKILNRESGNFLMRCYRLLQLTNSITNKVHFIQIHKIFILEQL